MSQSTTVGGPRRAARAGHHRSHRRRGQQRRRQRLGPGRDLHPGAASLRARARGRGLGDRPAFPTEIGGKLVFPAEPDRARGYGANADLPQRVMAGMTPIFDAPNPPDAQDVADAIVALIEMPAGTRPLRTVVDPLWGDGPRAINAVADQVQAGALQGMGMGDLLSVRKP